MSGSSPTTKLEPTPIGFRIAGVAHVDAAPHRSRRDARAIAQRIARDPAGYLSAAVELRLPGLRDLRGLVR